ncbi:hypothetical protein Pla52n_28590 [Stieleria varia]|uniref:Uncharacterized protein n=1 Tax=Stieleria varia TaxID=2528005 RepID=A0A5C6AXS6_9BACT|nr:hypothetical protein Pla52n_28590 [Stieleria varia]
MNNVKVSRLAGEAIVNSYRAYLFDDSAAQSLVLCLFGFAQVYVPTAGAAGGTSEPQTLAVGLRRIVVPAHG